MIFIVYYLIPIYDIARNRSTYEINALLKSRDIMNDLGLP